MGLTLWHSQLTGASGGAFYDPSSVSVLLSAMAVFELCRAAGANLADHPAACRAAAHMSVCSFGVYLAHPFFPERLADRYPAFPACALPLWLAIPLAALAIFAAAYAVSALVRKIPLVGKYLA